MIMAEKVGRNNSVWFLILRRREDALQFVSVSIYDLCRAQEAAVKIIPNPLIQGNPTPSVDALFFY